MYVACVFVLHATIAANALFGNAVLLHFMAITPATSVTGEPEPWLALPSGAFMTALPAGLLIAPFGAPLFGIVGVIVLFMFLASAITPSGRSRRNSPRLGLAVGFLVLAILTLVVKVAAP